MNASFDAKNPVLEEELQLAHLCANALTRRLQGTLSVGLTVAATNIVNPDQFLGDQFRVLEAIAIVMSSTGGRPLSQAQVIKLQATASGLHEALERLHTTFRNVRPNDLDGLEERLTALQELVAGICSEITSYQSQLGFDAPEVERVTEMMRGLIECMVKEARKGRSAFAPAGATSS